MSEIAKAATTSTHPQQNRPGGIAFASIGHSFGGILSGLLRSPSGRPAVATTVTDRPARISTWPQLGRTGAQVAPKKADVIPETAQLALRSAMALESVPPSWQRSLQDIMARESGGNVGIRNRHHSARGLYQLTVVNYHFNPRGKDSFGNAVEEAQGGIRYIKQRYKTAENALAFWQQHRWY